VIPVGGILDPFMQRIAVLLLLAVLARAGEEQDPWAAHGFPVTFNDEIITPGDVARSVGQPLEQMPVLTVLRQRDTLLNRKVAERVAALLGVVVDEQEVNQYLRREIEEQQGEAKFYESLAQRGVTLERYKQDLWQRVLDSKLQFLFQTGISPDQKSLLPARIRPTPRETQIAFDRDPRRQDQTVRVRRLELKIMPDSQTLKKIAAQRVVLELSPEQVKERLQAALKEPVEQVRKELATEPFEEVAKRRGVDVDAQKVEWIKATGTAEEQEFLEQGEAGTFREIPLEGEVRFLYVVERQRPGDRQLTDPAVVEEYEKRIRLLRAAKWEAILRIRALEESTVRPERVRDELREGYLSSLKEAEQGLRALGLH